VNCHEDDTVWWRIPATVCLNASICHLSLLSIVISGPTDSGQLDYLIHFDLIRAVYKVRMSEGARVQADLCAGLGPWV
jgi:hypothetical protein